jgi:hypothetical protein
MYVFTYIYMYVYKQFCIVYNTYNMSYKHVQKYIHMQIHKTCEANLPNSSPTNFEATPRAWAARIRIFGT